MPDIITCLFKEAHDAFPPLEGKLSSDDLIAIQETLLSLLMVIPYNQLNGVHSLTTILTKAVKYKANQCAKFVCPARLPLYNKRIADDPMTVNLFMQRLPTNPNLMTTPVMRWPNKAYPSFSATSLMRFGTIN